MPKGKPQIEIGKRTHEEILRLFQKTKDANKALGIKGNNLIYDWMRGVAPSAKYLQRMIYCGADVIYILTGVRSK